ncbi:MAG TPA: universal stress protein [Caulobacteraceae bacterium]|nr:universal stress protein [Caulobacteraceae bacterium]
MSFKTILTHVVADGGGEARLRMAASVAGAFSAKVIGVGATAPWPFQDEKGGSGPEFERLVGTARRDIAEAQRAFAAGLTGVSTEWRAEIGYPADVLTRQTAAADMVVAYRIRGGPEAAIYAPPDLLVMEAGLPVLLMPAKETPFAAETITLAWKNTREARRAITAALPLLTAARRVLVAAVCSDEDLARTERELRDVAARLAGHGISASTLAEVDASGAAGRRLARIAHTDGADLIVAGGYGHSRLREWILGGVTRDLIADGERWALLVH